jgi:hypothetical protein
MPGAKLDLITKKDWTVMRLKHAVQAGAGGVSVGDVLDDVHKAFSKGGLSSASKPLDTLSKNLKTYKNCVKKDSPKWVKDIERKVDPQVEEALKQVEQMGKKIAGICECQAELNKLLKDFDKDMPDKTPMQIYAMFNMIGNVADQLIKDDGHSSWQAIKKCCFGAANLATDVISQVKNRAKKGLNLEALSAYKHEFSQALKEIDKAMKSV